MTYFYLFSIAILAFAFFFSAVRVGVLEGRISMIERDHHALARKGGRVHPTLWHNLASREDADYD